MCGYAICEVAKDFSLKSNWRQTTLAGIEEGIVFSILNEMGIKMRKNASMKSVGAKIISYVNENCPEGSLLFL